MKAKSSKKRKTVGGGSSSVEKQLDQTMPLAKRPAHFPLHPLEPGGSYPRKVTAVTTQPQPRPSMPTDIGTGLSVSSTLQFPLRPRLEPKISTELILKIRALHVRADEQLSSPLPQDHTTDLSKLEQNSSVEVSLVDEQDSCSPTVSKSELALAEKEYVARIGELQSEIEVCDGQARECELRATELQSKSQLMKAFLDLDTLRKQYENTISEQQARANTLNEQVRALNNDVKARNITIAAQRSRLERMEAAHLENVGICTSQRTQLESTLAKAAQHEKYIGELQKENRRLEQEQAKDVKAQKLALERTWAVHLQKVRACEAQTASRQIELDGVLTRVVGYKIHIDELRKENAELKQERANANNSAKVALQTVLGIHDIQKEERAKFEAKIDDLEARITAMNRSSAAGQATIVIDADDACNT